MSVEKFFTWKRGANFKIAKYFNSSEFECPCSCEDQRIHIELPYRLDRVREGLGSALRITSGYRCAGYQAKLKAQGYETAVGVSQHELGKAADIQPVKSINLGFPSGMTKLKELCEEQFKATGQGRSFFHVDLRDDKERRWNYSTR